MKTSLGIAILGIEADKLTSMAVVTIWDIKAEEDEIPIGDGARVDGIGDVIDATI